MKIIALIGSLRKDSLNLELAKIVKTKLLDHDVEIVTLHDIPFFNEDMEFPTPETVLTLRNKIKKADGIWIFNPEYNNSYSGVLKNTLDWLSRPISIDEGHVLNDKRVAISGVTYGSFGTINAYNDLVKLMIFLNTKLMTKPRLTIPDGKNNLNDSNKLIDNAVKEFIKFIKN